MPSNIKQYCKMQGIKVNKSIIWDEDYEEIEDFCVTGNFQF